MIQDDTHQQALPLEAFAPQLPIDGARLQKVIELLQSPDAGARLADLVELAKSASDDATRLFTYLAFLSRFWPAKSDRSKATTSIFTKANALLASAELDEKTREMATTCLITHLIRLVRRFEEQGIADMFVDSLHKALTRMCADSPHAGVFQQLVGRPRRKVLERLRKLDAEQLGIGLCCAQPLTLAEYAEFLIQGDLTRPQPRLLEELRRLQAASPASFGALANYLLEDAHRMAHCAWLMAVGWKFESRDQFEFEVRQALSDIDLPFTQEDAYFTLRVLGMLVRALDAAANCEWSKALVILNDRNRYAGGGRLTHPKVVKALSKHLNKALADAEEDIRIAWLRTRDWLEGLDHSPNKG